MSDIEILPARAVIRLSGETRAKFLQGLITQDIDGLSTGPVFSALLTPQGKILHDFFIAEDGDDYLIDCAAGEAPALLKKLTLYKLREKITIALDESLSVAVSPDAIEGGRAFEDPRLPALGWRAFVAKQASDGSGAYEARRTALGVPEMAVDFGPEEMFLLDVNYDALNAVSYQKGCFVGQEVTSRMKRKGEIRKRTLVAGYDGELLPKDAKIIAGDSSLGAVLSAAPGRALALVRLDRLAQAQAASAAPLCNGAQVALTLPAYLEEG